MSFEDFYTDFPIFENLSGNTSCVDLILLHEAAANPNSKVDPNDIAYIMGIDADQPVIGNKYSLLLPVCFPNHVARMFGFETPLTIDGIVDDNGLMLYKFSNGKTYPIKEYRELSVMKEYLCSNKETFDRVLTTLAMRFNINTKINEKKVHASK